MGKPKLYFGIIDNGMGLSRTTWGACMFALGLSTVLDGYEIISESISYPCPCGSMNLATGIFLDSGAERMITIDTDLIFKPEHVAMLLSHDVPFVAGIYPKKIKGLYFPIELLTREVPFAEDPLAEGIEPLVEVKRVAKGFTAIHRNVFLNNRICPIGEDYWRLSAGGHSEDFELCDRMRAAGVKILVDQRILLKHEGSATYPLA